MLAAVVERWTSWEETPALEPRQVAEPELGPGESLLAVAAAAVGHIELSVISGEFMAVPPLPFIPGSEGAGTIVASETFEPGTPVRIRGGGIGIVRDGTWSERVAVPDEALEALPEGTDLEVAACYFSPVATAHSALHVVGGMHEGDRVAVTGATGAVASITMQLALRAGASRVVGFHRDPGGSAHLPAGAESVVWEGPATAERFAGEEAFDLVVDVVGGEILTALALRAVRPGGAVLLVGYAGSDELSASLVQLIVADVSLRP